MGHSVVTVRRYSASKTNPDRPEDIPKCEVCGENLPLSGMGVRMHLNKHVKVGQIAEAEAVILKQKGTLAVTAYYRQGFRQYGDAVMKSKF